MGFLKGLQILAQSRKLKSRLWGEEGFQEPSLELSDQEASGPDNPMPLLVPSPRSGIYVTDSAHYELNALGY